MAGGYIELDEEAEPTKKKRKVVVRAVRPTLASQFKAADLSAVKQVNSLFLSLFECISVSPCER